MNIGLIGYGKMGKSVHEIAEKRGHTVTVIVDQQLGHPLEALLGTHVDVVIEFTQPDSAVENITFCLNHGLPVVCGTTGWLDQYEKIKQLCDEKKGAFLQTTNFSLGVNIFFKLNKWLAGVLGQYPDYQISLEETHHTQKKDKPSGTAITIAENIISAHPDYDRYVVDQAPKIKEIRIDSIRKNEVPGTHAVSYESEVDTIDLVHTAKNRTGFALGAVLVAEWIRDKKGVFTMDDFIKI